MTTTTTRPRVPVTDRDPISRRAALGIGAGLLAVLAAVAAVRLTGRGPQPQDAATASVRVLRFEDTPAGGIRVIDHASGAELDLMTGEQGFLRGVLRSLMRERRRSELDLRAPLQLIARVDGRLTLVDPSTGRRIDLESFGPSNVAVFERWVAAPAR
jgi:putative photosynthetic complex assembly protein